jgi:mono/diheme cytochrome c family protein
MESHKRNWKMKTILIIPLFLLLTACTHRIAPPGESEMNNLSEEVIIGRQVFMDKCQRCHPNGMGGLGPSIVDKPLPGFLVRFQVRNGLGTMPSFDKEHLSKEDLDKLITYIKKH